jgi:hypothetical protein
MPVPDSTAMRRAVPAVLAALALGATGSACGHTAPTPGVPKADLTPGARLLVYSPMSCFGVGTSASTSSTARGECPALVTIVRPHDTSSTEQSLTSVPAGTVMIVSNTAGADQRLTGTIRSDLVFDTGAVRPGETTTVRLDTPGRMAIVDTTTGAKTSLTIFPKPRA